MPATDSARRVAATGCEGVSDSQRARPRTQGPKAMFAASAMPSEKKAIRRSKKRSRKEVTDPVSPTRTEAWTKSRPGSESAHRKRMGDHTTCLQVQKLHHCSTATRTREKTHAAWTQYLRSWSITGVRLLKRRPTVSAFSRARATDTYSKCDNRSLPLPNGSALSCRPLTANEMPPKHRRQTVPDSRDA